MKNLELTINDLFAEIQLAFMESSKIVSSNFNIVSLNKHTFPFRQLIS